MKRWFRQLSADPTLSENPAPAPIANRPRTVGRPGSALGLIQVCSLARAPYGPLHIPSCTPFAEGTWRP